MCLPGSTSESKTAQTDQHYFECMPPCAHQQSEVVSHGVVISRLPQELFPDGLAACILQQVFDDGVHLAAWQIATQALSLCVDNADSIAGFAGLTTQQETSFYQ